MPKFSIIVPVYNIADYLPACVDSIVRQSFKDYELLLIDDGATDNSGAICDKYANQHGDRVRALHKPNGGLSSARNFGLDAATGDYIFFIDGDDELCDDEALLKIAKRIDEYNEDIIIFGVQKYFINDKIYKLYNGSGYGLDNIAKDKWSIINYLVSVGKLPGAAWAYIVRFDIIKSIGLRFQEGVTAEDFYWYINCLYSANSIGHINDVIYTYNNQRLGSITSKPRLSGFYGVALAIDDWMSKDCGEEGQGITDFLCRVVFIMLCQIKGLQTTEEQDEAIRIMRKRIFILEQSSKRRYRLLSLLIQLFGINMVAVCLDKVWKLYNHYGKFKLT